MKHSKMLGYLIVILIFAICEIFTILEYGAVYMPLSFAIFVDSIVLFKIVENLLKK